MTVEKERKRVEIEKANVWLVLWMSGSMDKLDWANERQNPKSRFPKT